MPKTTKALPVPAKRNTNSSSSYSAGSYYGSGQAFVSTFGSGAQWLYDQLTAYFPSPSTVGLAMPEGAMASDMLNQLYSMVQGAMPNPDVLSALAQLTRTDFMAADVADQITSVILTNPDLHEAVRNVDPQGAATALTTALNDQSLVGALGHLFTNKGAIAGILSSDKIFSLLLLHVVKKAAQPMFNAIVDNISLVAGTLVNDEIGKKVIDAAVVRACPKHKAELLKGLDFANGDPEAKEAFKQFLIDAMATAAPEDRKKILEAVFADAFVTPTGPNYQAHQAKDKKTHPSGLKPTKATESLKTAEQEDEQAELVKDLIDDVAQQEPSDKRTMDEKLDELIDACADQGQSQPTKTVD